MINPPLLQSQIQFWFRQSTGSLVVGILLFIGFIILIIVGGMAYNKRQGPTRAARQTYSRSIFRRIAGNMGLNTVQTDMLEKLVKVCRVRQPFLVFSNAGLLDDILRKGIYSLSHDTEISQEVRDSKTAQYYHIKEKIEQNAKKGVGINSTHLVKPGQPVTIIVPDRSQHSTRVVQNLQRLLVCAAPEKMVANREPWRRGAKIAVLFWRARDSGYQFVTKIAGFDKVKGEPVILLQHNNRSLQRNQHRKTRRRSLIRSCFFYPIELMTVGTGRQARKRAYVQQRFKHLGTIQDISAGGCSIASQSPLESGRLLMMQFEIDRGKQVTSYGKVRRVKKERGQMAVMHIMNTKVTSLNLNNIYSYVYDYIPTAQGTPMGGKTSSSYRLTRSGNLSNLKNR